MLRMIRGLATLLLAGAGVFLSAGVPLAAGDDDDRLERELERLKGRWERLVPDSQPPQKEILFIQGDKEMFTVENLDGKVLRKLTARIRLETEGDAGIYTRSDIKLVAGNPPADPLPKSQSFIYKLSMGQLHEMSGLLYDRTGSRQQPAHIVWTQPDAQPQAVGRNLPFAAPDPVPDSPETKRDLETLQGRWERISRDAEGKVTFSQEKLVEGNEETLTNRNADGKIVHKHTVKFRLEKHGPVRIYNFYEITVYSEDGAGETRPADYSFIYKLDGKTFLDAPGLFWSRPTYLPNPALHTWVRPETKE